MSPGLLHFSDLRGTSVRRMERIDDREFRWTCIILQLIVIDLLSYSRKRKGDSTGPDDRELVHWEGYFLILLEYF